MMSPKGAHALLDELRLAQARLEGRVTAEYRAALEEMFIDLVETTPQWSGNLATNWYIKIGAGRNPPYKEHIGYNLAWGAYGVFEMGDDPAFSDVVARELPKLMRLRWNQTVTFVNRAPYSAEVQAGLGPEGREIRDVNLGPSGEVMMGEYIKVKYGSRGYNIVTR